MYERLTRVLNQLGEQNAELNAAWILKIGCTALADNPDPEPGSRYPVFELTKKWEEQRVRDTEQRRSRKPSHLTNALVQALERHPNIFDLSSVKPERKQHLVHPEEASY